MSTLCNKEFNSNKLDDIRAINTRYFHMIHDNADNNLDFIQINQNNGIIDKINKIETKIETKIEKYKINTIESINDRTIENVEVNLNNS